MILNNEIKLSYDDVLIVPQRSKLSSRKDVNLIRTFKTQYSNDDITGIPIIAANMATGNFNMAKVFIQNKMFTAIAKHHWKEWDTILNQSDKEDYLNYCFFTIGKS